MTAACVGNPFSFCDALRLCLQVGKRKKITIKPKAPKFPVSPQVAVTVGQALHTVVYGPYRSPKHEHGLFPYAHDAGQGFHKQNYQFYLASNSRIMNPVYSPKTSDNGDNRTDYFAKQKVSQKPASSIMNQLLETLCGGDLSDEVPELYGELQEVLEELRVYHLNPATALYSHCRPTLSLPLPPANCSPASPQHLGSCFNHSSHPTSPICSWALHAMSCITAILTVSHGNSKSLQRCNLCLIKTQLVQSIHHVSM